MNSVSNDFLKNFERTCQYFCYSSCVLQDALSTGGLLGIMGMHWEPIWGSSDNQNEVFSKWHIYFWKNHDSATNPFQEPPGAISVILLNYIIIWCLLHTLRHLDVDVFNSCMYAPIWRIEKQCWIFHQGTISQNHEGWDFVLQRNTE